MNRTRKIAAWRLKPEDISAVEHWVFHIFHMDKEIHGNSLKFLSSSWTLNPQLMVLEGTYQGEHFVNRLLPLDDVMKVVQDSRELRKNILAAGEDYRKKRDAEILEALKQKGIRP